MTGREYFVLETGKEYEINYEDGKEVTGIVRKIINETVIVIKDEYIAISDINSVEEL